jgi:hypothetical protein
VLLEKAGVNKGTLSTGVNENLGVDDRTVDRKDRCGQGKTETRRVRVGLGQHLAEKPVVFF